MLLSFVDLRVACDCDEDGSQDLICDNKNGQCNCHDGITNRTCNSCVNEDYWGPKDGQCRSCTCAPENTVECVQVSWRYAIDVTGELCLSDILRAEWILMLQCIKVVFVH